MSTKEILTKLDRIEKLLKVLVVFEVRALNQIESDEKLEVFLSALGLSNQDIADIVGKSKGAVATILSRAKS